MKKIKFVFLLMFLFLITSNLYSYNPFVDEEPQSAFSFFGLDTSTEIGFGLPYVYYGDDSFQDVFSSDLYDRTSFIANLGFYLRLPESKLFFGLGFNIHFDNAVYNSEQLDIHEEAAYVRYLYVSARAKYFFKEPRKGVHVLGGLGTIYNIFGQDVGETKAFQFDFGLGYAIPIYKDLSFAPSIDYSFTPIAGINASSISINIKLMN